MSLALLNCVGVRIKFVSHFSKNGEVIYIHEQIFHSIFWYSREESMRFEGKEVYLK